MVSKSTVAVENTVFDKRTKKTTDVWLTPPHIIQSLGSFDLDPASPVNRPWDTARHHYNEIDNGLSKKWIGRVFCNPPYGRQLPLWLERLADHGNGIGLIFSRTETKYFHEHVWPKADAVFFFKGRLKFFRPDGTQAKKNATAPSCLIAYGQNNVAAIRAAINSGALKGHLVELEGNP